MLRLAVTTRAETFERLREPLDARGIEVVHVRPTERTIPLTDAPTAEVDEPASDAGSAPFPAVDVGFVYPSRVMEGGAVDALLGVPWVNDREAILTSRNKAGVLARLSRAGLPVPETVLVSNPADEDALVDAAEGIGFPLVVKPNSTTRGVGVARVVDVDSLLGVTDYLDLIHEFPATGDRSFLLQAYLPDARDYRAMVVDGRYVGAVERRLPEPDRAAGKWKHNVHRGAEARGVDLPPDRRRLAERAAEALGIDYLGVDLLVAGDRAVVSETNARPTVDAATKYEPGFFDDLAALIERTADGAQ